MDIFEFDDTTCYHPPAKFAMVNDFYAAARFFPTICIDFVIVSDDDGRVYMAKRRIEPGGGMYSFIGGRRYAYESVAASRKRIFKDEAGLDIGEYEIQFVSCSEVMCDLRHDFVITYKVFMSNAAIRKIKLSSEEYVWDSLTPYIPNETVCLAYHKNVCNKLCSVVYG